MARETIATSGISTDTVEVISEGNIFDLQIKENLRLSSQDWTSLSLKEVT